MQAAFRGFQVRRQYRKVLWSVGVLEKAVLRWRFKRRGLRGLNVAPVEVDVDQKQESDTEEDFYRASRKQAEERIERSVVRVQAMFRSKKAQEEYSRMKLTHIEAKVSDLVRILLSMLQYNSANTLANQIFIFCSWNSKSFWILTLTWIVEVIPEV